MGRRPSPWLVAAVAGLATTVASLAYSSSGGPSPVASPPAATLEATGPPVAPTAPTPSDPESEPAESPPPSPLPPSPQPAPPPAFTADDLASYAAQLPADAIEIAAVGDVNLGGTIGELILRSGPGYFWSQVSPLLQSADVAFANFESTATRRGTPADKAFVFRSDPDSLAAMAAAGIDVASVANNHALDYGPDALLDTIANLRAAGIRSVGAGANDREAFAPVTVDVRGVRFAFIAASRVLPAGWAATSTGPGVASAYQKARLLAEVAAARAAGAVVVVSVHWGVERSTTPEDYQVELAHALVDAGASIVLGHHPHVLQPVVRYQGAIIAYSLGNFVFTAPELEQTSMILRIGWRPGHEPVLVSQPVRIVGGQPRPG